jgi:diguanylate cyclase (GGDEF)-like protein
VKPVNREILEQVILSSADPVLVIRIDHPDWPVELCNPAFAAVDAADVLGRPFSDVIEQLVGRELALEVSESLRTKQETRLPLEINGREYLLALKPLSLPDDADASYFAAFWRGGSGAVDPAGATAQHELLKAKRHIRDLSRDDTVTGLLNNAAFRDVLAHDWAVAAREKTALALVVLTLNDFDAYLDVFGRHATDSCLRRVGQGIRRCVQRASDVVARLDDERFVVLSHASEDDGVNEFAARISTAVRELGLHHPRSRAGRFVTVSYQISVTDAARDSRAAEKFLDDLLASPPTGTPTR